MKHKIKSAKTTLCKLLVGTLACTTLFGSVPLAQAYGATDVAASLSQRYVVEEAKQMSGVKVLFKNQDMTDTFTNPVINVNDRVYLPIRDISTLIGAEIKWEGDEIRVATINYNGKVIEIPIGSDKIVVDGSAVPIDNNGTKALLYKQRSYLPLRVILEYCGFPVDYQVVGDIKYVLIDSQVPNPDLHTYDNEIEVPEKYKDTTFLEVYHSLRTSGLTEEQAKIVMGTVKSFAPLSNENHQKDKYMGECGRSSECMEINSATPDITIKGEWYLQPHPTQKGWYWNGNNWECGESIYFGYGQ